MSPRASTWAAASLMSFLLVGCASTLKLANAPSTTVDLSGHWSLDRNRSEDPRAKLMGGFADAGRFGGEGRGRRGRGGMDGERGGMGGHGGPPDSSRRMPGMGQRHRPTETNGERMGGPMRAALDGAQELVITQQSQQVVLQSDDRPARPVAITAKAQDPTQPHAGWQGDQLVVVVPGPGGGTVTQTYVLSPRDGSLQQTTLLEGKRMRKPITIQRVYVRQPEPAAVAH